jgi:ppGpp synthetase/RelA/SpoT-type nucleotidyltranferase
MELQELEKEVRQTVSQYCLQRGFAYAGRPKTLESLAEKIETGRFGKWSDLDDFYGCAVIVPTLEHEADALGFLRRAFLEMSIKARGSTNKPPDAFRFESTRFIGRLNPIRTSDAGLPRYNTNFEVQIRSAFEHAWCATTHALAYKAGKIDWRNQRLAAQLKAAVEQLDQIVLGFERAADAIVEHAWAPVSLRRKIAEAFAEYVATGRVPAELAPKDWSRFADNLYSLINAGRKVPKHTVGDEQLVNEAISCLEKAIPADPRTVPHSLSLLQFSFGVMANAGIVTPPLRNFCPLITDELAILYPAVSGFSPRFQMDG